MMTEEAKKKRGCFKYGLFGCLGSVAFLVLAFGTIIGLGLISSLKEPQIERRDLAQELPQASPSPPSPITKIEKPENSSDAEDLTDREAPAGFRLGAEQVQVKEPGRIHLDVGTVDFQIVPGPPGQPIRIEAEYDAARFTLEENFESYGEVGWSYRLEFGPKGLFNIMFGEQRLHEVRLILPRDSPMILTGTVGIGTSDLELGGLWLLDVDLDFSMGEHELSFDEPLAGPLERIDLKGSMGVLAINDLGNASPRTAEFDHSMGEFELDLTGLWVRDAEMAVRCGMGECRIRLPRNTAVELDSRIALGEKDVRGLEELPDSGPGVPTLHLEASHSMGELSIRP